MPLNIGVRPDKNDVGMNPLAYRITRNTLKRLAREHLSTEPQLACHAFDLITLAIHLDGKYERDELDLLSRRVFPTLAPGGVCLDIGANIGNHSLHFARHFRQVISLEPHPRNFALLEINARLAENILPINIGASNRIEKAEIVENRSNLGASSLHHGRDQDGRRVTFHLDRIDAIPAIQSAGPIAFMKLDIEGHEAMAITGAEATIRRDHPLIALEVLKEEICDGTAASIEALRNMGYQHFHIPVESGLTGRVSSRFRKPLRNLQTVFSGKRPSKAGTLRRIDRLEQRNYPMVLCAHDPPQYAD